MLLGLKHLSLLCTKTYKFKKMLLGHAPGKITAYAQYRTASNRHLSYFGGYFQTPALHPGEIILHRFKNLLTGSGL